MTVRERSQGGRGEAGFILLEVLVAAVIAALAIGVLLHGGLASVASARVSSQYMEAVSRVRSHLAALDSGSALQPGEAQGDDGSGFRWATRIMPAATAPIGRGGDSEMRRGPRVVLYAVSVLVSWQGDGGAREVRLDTERVGTAPAAAP